MTKYILHISQIRPYFAEIPYAIWGEVNYDSDGDCENPLDCNWTWMDLTHRETGEHVEIASEGEQWTISGDDPAARRAALFLQARCAAKPLSPATIDGAGWDLQAACTRAARVAKEFENDQLRPFAQGHMFWGSWKWIGWFATDFTWVGRWIMDSVIRNDPRAVFLCIDWLRDGTFAPAQSEALCHALKRLTSLDHATDAQWIGWYEAAGKKTYPEPDFKAWHEELKALYGN